MIDFTMNGLNICLLIGIVLLLQGICFLFKGDVVRDFAVSEDVAIMNGNIATKAGYVSPQATYY